jgi:integrase/recombinase XerC
MRSEVRTVHSWPEALTGFLLDAEARSLSPHTLSAYRRDLEGFAESHRRHAGPLAGPAQVTPTDVGRWHREEVARGLRPATINRHLATLRAFYSWAVFAEVAAADPTRRCRRVPEASPAPRSLPEAQAQALLDAARHSGNLRNEALLTLLLHTGLRVGEATRLRWDDITLRAGEETVLVRAGKGGKWRTVPLSAPAATVLRRLRAAAAVPLPRAGGFVFLGRRASAPMNTRTANWIVHRIAALAGLRVRITPHMLRHTFCKSLVGAGVSLDRVAALAGHASLTMTARYTRPTDSDLRQAVRLLPFASRCGDGEAENRG